MYQSPIEEWRTLDEPVHTPFASFFTFESDSNNPSPPPNDAPAFQAHPPRAAAPRTARSAHPHPIDWVPAPQQHDSAPRSADNDSRQGWAVLDGIFEPSALELPLPLATGVLLGSHRSAAAAAAAPISPQPRLRASAVEMPRTDPDATPPPHAVAAASTPNGGARGGGPGGSGGRQQRGGSAGRRLELADCDPGDPAAACH